MVGYESSDCAALPHRSWSIRPKTISAWDSWALFLLRFLGPGLHSLAIILILTSALVPKSKVQSASTTIKIEFYTINDCEDWKECQEVPQSNKLQGSITNKSTARGITIKKECMRLSKSKELPWGAKIKRIARDTTIWRTAKEYHNQNYYRSLSAKINQNFCQKDHNQKDC